MLRKLSTTTSLVALTATTILLAICLPLNAGYSGIIPPNPDHPDKCVYRGDMLELGINRGISPCQQLTCNNDGSILVEGCGRLRFANCNSGERVHPEKLYPDCCTIRYKCKRRDGSSYFIEKDAFSNGEGVA